MNTPKKRKRKIIVLLLCLFILLIAGAFCLYLYRITPRPEPNFDPNAVDWIGDQELTKEKIQAENINLPCFEKLVFTSGLTEQKVNFHNPADNSCYLKISLMVNEEILWESELLAPDKGFYTIELQHPLDIGHYDAYLLYQCFSLDDLSPYNNARVAVDVISQ